MVKLLALSPEDGWAFVQSGGEVLLVKPPYSKASTSVVPAGAAEKAVQTYDFSAAEMDFPSWGELISYLQRQLARSRAGGSGIPAELTALVTGIVGNAPVSIVVKCLNRIREELIPSGEWQSAFTLLHGLYRSEVARENVEVRREITDLLDECTTRILKNTLGRCILAEEDLSKCFPNASAAYGEDAIQHATRKIREQKQVFAVGGH